MSKSVRSTSDTETMTPAEEARTDGSNLAALGYVLEVTARDPDTRIKNEFQVEKIIPGAIFDLWHHPCSAKDKIDGLCKHKDTPPGDWKKVPTADKTRCVN